MSLATLGKKLAVTLQSMVMVLSVTSASIGGAMISTSALAASTPCDPSSQVGPNASDPVASGAQCSQGGSQKSNLFGNGGIFTIIANTLIFVIGAVSVIYLIVGGLRYVTSGGDSKAVTAAKDTILYAVVGIVVAVISFAIVQFVVSSLAQAN